MPIATKYRPHYTYEDYCQWEGRWELIEGMPYAMAPAPAPQHQRTSILLGSVFERATAGCKNCKVYDPIDWKIADDTVVQPDLLIVCNEIKKAYLDFPPSLVSEILSPSTTSKDRNEKMELYLSQKVKYYIIVDPRFRKVEVYQFINGQYEPVAINPEKYSFDLYEGCNAEVNLSEIWD
jgi:Uma2 family endonuclease